MNGDLKIEVYSPKEEVYDDENDYSLVIRIEYKEDTFPFAGDVIQLIDELNIKFAIITCEAEEDVSADILNELKNIDLQVYSIAMEV